MNKTQVAYFVKKFIVILSKEIDKNKYTIFLSKKRKKRKEAQA